MPRLTPQLETDDNLLVPKARAALERYGHQLVIGNELHKRKAEVVFVERPLHGKGGGDAGLTGALTPPLEAESEDKRVGTPAKFTETWLRLSELAKGRGDEVKIEEFIISSLRQRHNEWIAAGKA